MKAVGSLYFFGGNCEKADILSQVRELCKIVEGRILQIVRGRSPRLYRSVPIMPDRRQCVDDTDCRGTGGNKEADRI